MPESVEVLALGVEEIPVAAAVLAGAFVADPPSVYLFPDRAERSRLPPLEFAVVVRYHCVFGRADRLGTLGGVALWLGPGQVETPEVARGRLRSVVGAGRKVARRANGRRGPGCRGVAA